MKNKAWKYATAFVVVLIMLNPEMIELAIFIDAVGLDMFLLLFEIQILAILSSLLNTKIRPIFNCIEKFMAKRFTRVSWDGVKSNPGLLIFVTPSPAALMNVLVLSYISYIVLDSVL